MKNKTSKNLFIFDLRNVSKEADKIDFPRFWQKVEEAAKQGHDIWIITKDENVANQDIAKSYKNIQVTVKNNDDPVTFVQQIARGVGSINLPKEENEVVKKYTKSNYTRHVTLQRNKHINGFDLQRYLKHSLSAREIREQEEKDEHSNDVTNEESNKEISMGASAEQSQKSEASEEEYDQTSASTSQVYRLTEITDKIELENGKYLFIIDSRLVKDVEKFSVFYKEVLKKRNRIAVLCGSENNTNLIKKEKLDGVIFEDKVGEKVEEIPILNRVKALVAHFKKHIQFESSVVIFTTQDNVPFLKTIYNHTHGRTVEQLSDYFDLYIKGARDEEAQRLHYESNQERAKRAGKKVGEVAVSTVTAVVPGGINALLRPLNAKPQDLNLELLERVDFLKGLEAGASTAGYLTVNIPIGMEYIFPAYLKVYQILRKIVVDRKAPTKTEGGALFLGLLTVITMTALSVDSLKAAPAALDIIFSAASTVTSFATRFGGALTVLNSFFDPDTIAQEKFLRLLKRLKEEGKVDLEHIYIAMLEETGTRKEVDQAIKEFIKLTLDEMEAKGIPIPAMSRTELVGKCFDIFLMLFSTAIIAPMWAAKSNEGLEIIFPALKSSKIWNNNLVKVPVGYIMGSATLMFYMLNIYHFRSRAVKLVKQLYHEKINAARDRIIAGGMTVALAFSGTAIMEVMHEVIDDKMIVCLDWVKDGVHSFIEGATFGITDIVNASIVYKWLGKKLDEKNLEGIDINIAPQLLEQRLATPSKGVSEIVNKHGIFKVVKTKNGYSSVPQSGLPQSTDKPLRSVTSSEEFAELTNGKDKDATHETNGNEKKGNKIAEITTSGSIGLSGKDGNKGENINNISNKEESQVNENDCYEANCTII